MSSSARSAAIATLNGRSDAKRDAILRGAKAVFLKHGFESTSMDVVALRAGVSKMTVYRHFGSKEALFAGVITNLCERIVDGDLREIFELPPREALMTFARKMIAIVFAHETVELHRIVIAESRRFPKLGRLFYQSGPESCIAALAAYFHRHVDDARFKVRNPRRAAEEFLELLRGYAHLRVMLGLERIPSSAEMEERIEGAIRHVLN
jgi:TetR/AcrR family transcriptional regulator, mexJK operon transcriptional repressor